MGFLHFPCKRKPPFHDAAIDRVESKYFSIDRRNVFYNLTKGKVSQIRFATIFSPLAIPFYLMLAYNLIAKKSFARNSNSCLRNPRSI